LLGALRVSASGGTRIDAVGLERCDLIAVPVAGVGEGGLGLLLDPGALELGLGGLCHRRQAVAFVAAGYDLGGDDHLLFG
jgi:hypothetical protein